jgi:hypothetical protein
LLATLKRRNAFSKQFQHQIDSDKSDAPVQSKDEGVHQKLHSLIPNPFPKSNESLKTLAQKTLASSILAKQCAQRVRRTNLIFSFALWQPAWYMKST